MIVTEELKSLQASFSAIVTEMALEVETLKKANAELEKKLRIANFPTVQATKCGRCGEFKHTPWKDDELGYICVTCLVEIKDEEIARLNGEP
jgi:hypothetical protein